MSAEESPKCEAVKPASAVLDLTHKPSRSLAKELGALAQDSSAQAHKFAKAVPQKSNISLHFSPSLITSTLFALGKVLHNLNISQNKVNFDASVTVHKCLPITMEMLKRELGASWGFHPPPR